MGGGLTGLHPHPAKPRTIPRPHAQKGKANTIPSPPGPAQGRSLPFTVLYHQLANAMVITGFALSNTTQDPARTRGAVLKALSSTPPALGRAGTELGESRSCQVGGHLGGA